LDLITVKIVEDVDKGVGLLKVVAEFLKGFGADKVLGDFGPELTLGGPITEFAGATNADIGVAVDSDPSARSGNINNGPTFGFGLKVLEESRSARGSGSQSSRGVPWRREALAFGPFSIATVADRPLDFAVSRYTSTSSSLLVDVVVMMVLMAMINVDILIEAQSSSLVPFAAISSLTDLHQSFTLGNGLATWWGRSWWLGDDVNGSMVDVNMVVVVNMLMFVLGDLDSRIDLDLTDRDDRLFLEGNFV